MSGTDAARTPPAGNTAEHWDLAYAGRPPDRAGWYQPRPAESLRMLETLGSTSADAVVDVGGGVGVLALALVDRGYQDVTVVELSAGALRLARRRCEGTPVALVHADVLDWRPSRSYDVWHDRAVFHFLTTPEQRDRYRATLRHAIGPSGAVVIGAFARDAPPSCSGLPVVRYDAAELHRAMGEGFVVVADAREEHHTPGGAIQPFTWLALRRTG